MNHRRGFTLIELFVVISIIAMLVALLLPAVQQAREAARRTQCRNNLKQIGLALHNYHDMANSFPPGWVYDASRAAPDAPTNCWGWSAMILPYLDQAPLYARLNLRTGFSGGLDVGGTNSSSGLTGIEATPLAVFRCPSDLGGEQVLSGSLGPIAGMAYGGRSNYPGVNGGLFFDAPPIGHQGGTFGENSRRALRDMTDGSSNSAIVGERAWAEVPGTGSGPSALWAGTRSGIPGTETANGVALAVGQCVTPINTPPEAGHSPIGGGSADPSWHGFTSRHPQCANFLLGDGAVRTISDTVDYRTYGRLGTLSDGQPVGEF